MQSLPLLWLTLFLWLSGCSDTAFSTVKAFVTQAKVWIHTVQFIVPDDMNDSAPVTIQLLIIYKQEIFDQVAKMSSSDFFQKTDQLKRDNPGLIDFNTWTLVPGQMKEAQNIFPSRTDGVGAIIFARYKSPGDHRAVIGDAQVIRIVLEATDFSIEKLS